MNTKDATKIINVTTQSLNAFADALFNGVEGEMDCWLEVNSDAEFRWHVNALIRDQALVNRVPAGADHQAALTQSFEAALRSDEETRSWLESHLDEDDVRKAVFAFALATNSKWCSKALQPGEVAIEDIAQTSAHIKAGRMRQLDDDDFPPMHEHWQVEVLANNEKLVSIGRDWVCGLRDLSEMDENTIVGAARHLLSFMGCGLPAAVPSSPVLEQKPRAWAWPGESGLVFTEDAEKAQAARLMDLDVFELYRPAITDSDIPF
ncbi:hypothetical protein [Hydrogenophaga sp. NFH-34]|uniref:hypothetical protein n=1 Tax=Hydrogenophaga sp. NFH-34 TaxID=2744446 RepID=UPI001F29BCEB|nr:hypothetical protein [Hydrogenophaga sp. NFH-34]